MKLVAMMLIFSKQLPHQGRTRRYGRGKTQSVRPNRCKLYPVLSTYATNDPNNRIEPLNNKLPLSQTD